MATIIYKEKQRLAQRGKEKKAQMAMGKGTPAVLPYGDIRNLVARRPPAPPIPENEVSPPIPGGYKRTVIAKAPPLGPKQPTNVAPGTPPKAPSVVASTGMQLPVRPDAGQKVVLTTNSLQQKMGYSAGSRGQAGR